jgi:hypothetical protein
MTQMAPKVFAVQVELDGKSYSTSCSSFSGVVTLLHPVYNRGGAILRRGASAEQTAQVLFRSGLERLKARGDLP